MNYRVVILCAALCCATTVSAMQYPTGGPGHQPPGRHMQGPGNRPAMGGKPHNPLFAFVDNNLEARALAAITGEDLQATRTELAQTPLPHLLRMKLIHFEDFAAAMESELTALSGALQKSGYLSAKQVEYLEKGRAKRRDSDCRAGPGRRH